MAALRPIGIKDFKATLSEIGERFGSLAEDDLFVLWFLRAYVTENENDAAAALAGGARDKNIDAVFIDDAARTVFLVQGKYRQAVGTKIESRSDVIGFAEVSHTLCESSESVFRQYSAAMEGATAELAKRARKKLVGERYRLRLFYITLGKVSDSHRDDAKAVVRRAKCDAAIEVIDGKRAMVIFRDYLDGVAPPIPLLDLEMESNPNVRVNGIANRFDDEAGIESWVFSMRGDAVGSLYESSGVRLFARNIRGFLGGSTAVNEGMAKTLQTEPARFFYYNNGITIICDAAEKKSSKGRDILQVSNPQVINGQQTTRTLAGLPRQAAKGSVLVKVICVPRDEKLDGYDDLVSRIVAGTNWQNAIKPSDLMSNDRRQIELERALRKIGYLYLRKRQKKGEARRDAGGKHYRVVKKEELAQAVAGCDLDPAVIRAGRERLFEERLYDQIFPNGDPEFYLSRYWLMRAVTYGARGKPQRAYAKWLVLNFMWSHLRPLVGGKRRLRAFRMMSEKTQADLITPLERAINNAFVEALRYYREHRGVGDTQVDISQFFRNKRSHHTAFAREWDDRRSIAKQPFETAMTKIGAALQEFEE